MSPALGIPTNKSNMFDKHLTVVTLKTLIIRSTNQNCDSKLKYLKTGSYYYTSQLFCFRAQNFRYFRFQIVIRN